MRRYVLGLLLLSGCYWKTPTHDPQGADDTTDPASADAGDVDPRDDQDGQTGIETVDFDAGVAVLSDGAVVPLDAIALSDATEPLDAFMSARDTGVEAGPACSCSAAKPVCIPASGTCVQCTADSQCSAGTYCQTSPASPLVNTCVQCRQERDCTGGKHCLVETGQCVACLNANHCAGLPSTSACDEVTHQCRACTADAECSNIPGRAVCQAGTCVQCAGSKRAACGEDRPACSTTSFMCETCKADSDCSRFNKVCDEASAKCVECTVDSEAARCGMRSCNPATFTCTQTNRGSVDVCLPCLADSECVSNHRCIALTFGGASQGGFCLRQESATCVEPYSTRITRASLSRAASANYCGFSEQRTSCPAIRALLSNRACPNGSTDCDAPGAMCGTVGTLMQRCTYACTLSAECPAAAPCPTAGTNRYCGKSM